MENFGDVSPLWSFCFQRKGSKNYFQGGKVMDRKRDLLESYSELNYVESSLIWESKEDQNRKRNEMIILRRRWM